MRLLRKIHSKKRVASQIHSSIERLQGRFQSPFDPPSASWGIKSVDSAILKVPTLKSFVFHQWRHWFLAKPTELEFTPMLNPWIAQQSLAYHKKTCKNSYLARSACIPIYGPRSWRTFTTCILPGLVGADSPQYVSRLSSREASLLILLFRSLLLQNQVQNAKTRNPSQKQKTPNPITDFRRFISTRTIRLLPRLPACIALYVSSILLPTSLFFWP